MSDIPGGTPTFFAVILVRALIGGLWGTVLFWAVFHLLGPASDAWPLVAYYAMVMAGLYLSLPTDD